MQIEAKDQVSCRICLSDETDSENPMVSLCYCTGTMGIMHVACLQQWLSSKITHSTQGSVNIYSWKSLGCEICKFRYPDKIRIDGQAVDLVAIDKPEGGFIIFEKCGEETNSLMVLPMSGKTDIKLGRGNDADLRITDISVSRNHASIKVKNSGLYLEDLSSKFGTLVRIKKDIVMDVGSKVWIQSGRTLLKVSVSKTWNLFGCFSGCSKGKESDEEMQRYARDTTQETYY